VSPASRCCQLNSTDEDSVPPNCSFEIDDLEKDWTWTKPFDFLFCRSLSTAFGDWGAVMKKAYKYVSLPSDC
jgi:hypothetical protein